MLAEAQVDCPPRNWVGTLSQNNVQQIVAWLHGLLDGKECLFVHVTTADPAHPRIKSEEGHLVAEQGGDTIQAVVKDDGHVSIGFSATDGWCYCFDSDTPYQSDDFKNPKISFLHETVTFTSRAPCGDLCIVHVVPIRPWSDNDWYWSRSQEAFLCGSRKDGAGVFADKGKWYGNVVVGSQMVGIGPCDTQEKAQADCLIELCNLRLLLCE